jgi:hypothetical protein
MQIQGGLLTDVDFWARKKDVKDSRNNFLLDLLILARKIVTNNM